MWQCLVLHNEVLTERYLIFRGKQERKFLWISYIKNISVGLRVPKHYEKDYQNKFIEFLKEGVSLTDRGFYHSLFDGDSLETARHKIAEYQIKKNEVWE